MTNETNLNLSVTTSAMVVNDKSGHQTASFLSDTAKVSATGPSVEETDKLRLLGAGQVSENNKAVEKDQITQVNSLSQTELEKQAQELQEISFNKNWGVSFSVDKELNQTVIKVIDAETEKTIRQIPSEEFLEISRRVQALQDGDESSSNLTGIVFNNQA